MRFERGHALAQAAVERRGEAAIVTPLDGDPVETTAIFSRDVVEAIAGFNAVVTERRTFLSIPKAAIAGTPIGATITVGETTYTVDAVEKDDGLMLKLVVRT